MENLCEKKFDKLSDEEMKSLNGGISWSVWKTIEDDCGGSYTQRYNWFGAHGTSELD